MAVVLVSNFISIYIDTNDLIPLWFFICFDIAYIKTFLGVFGYVQYIHEKVMYCDCVHVKFALVVTVE